MASEIQNSVIGIQAYWQNNIDETTVGKALEELSSSYGVDYSAKDVVGLSTSQEVDRELMRIELQRLEKSKYNIDQASSMLQTADKALDDIFDKLLRIKDLAAQAATQGRNDRSVLAAEANALVNNIDEIVKRTEYNDQTIIDGSLAAGTGIGVLDQNGNELIVKLASAAADRLGLSAGDTPLNELNTGGAGDLSTTEGAVKALEILDDAIQDVKAMKGNIDAIQSMMNDQSSNTENVLANVTVAASTIGDIGSAYQTTAYIKNQILMDSSRAILAQANLNPQSVLSLLGLT
jgi:flagellin